VYLKGYSDGREARVGIASWIAFYDGQRPVWRDGVTGPVGNNAVDMVDNASAFPHAHSSSNKGDQRCSQYDRRNREQQTFT
jgi:hypothetical protein